MSSLRRYEFTHRDRPFACQVTRDGTLELYLNGILRKDRPAGTGEPQYVWTNVELEWEEHHYIELRYWASTHRLDIHINRQPFRSVLLAPL